MRRSLVLLMLIAAMASPLAAQNTDIESLSGLQFNFGNPGARSLGMGGAFLGLADDASAAEANPAGLTILRKPEITIEGRNFKEQQVLTTSGTFPDFTRTAFSSYSDRAQVTFGSVVYPIKNFTLGAYFHEPLNNRGSGSVVPVTTGSDQHDLPNFFLARGGQAPISETACLQMRQQTGDPFSCLQYNVTAFLSAVEVKQRTYGLAAAWKIGKFSLGVTGRYQTFNEAAFTYRVDDNFRFVSIVVQATGDLTKTTKLKDQNDITVTGGFKWEPTEMFSIGGVYKQGPKFVSPTFYATSDTKFSYLKLADTTFHVPDVYGLGVSVRPIPVLTVNVDGVRVKYSNLVDDFVSISQSVRDAGNVFKANDILELHAGAEYFFATKIPFAIRAGFWHDPRHSVEYNGPINTVDRIASAILYPKGKSQNHRSIGGGLAWPRFQIDFAYDTAKLYKVGSVSMVTRF